MRFALFFLAAGICCSAANAQDGVVIQLKQDAAGYAPKGYYISDVVDERTDQAAIGALHQGGKTGPVSLKGGAAMSIRGFIDHSISQSKATQPIVLHITKLDVDIRKSGDTRQVEAAATFTFYAAGKKIVEYSGKGRAQMDDDPADYIDGFIRQAITNDMKKFEGWWAENGGGVPTASAVKVIVTIGRTTDKPNCIVYSLQRPLSIADFTGPVEGQVSELAATFSGIGMGYSGTTQNGQVVLSVTVTPYFDKSQSWFKEAGKNPRVLAHEQAHFDITAIKACELAAAIRNTPFTQENYSGLIEQLQKQNAQDANDEESTYDNETNHGTIEDKQIEWQNKIRQKVREIGCY